MGYRSDVVAVFYTLQTHKVGASEQENKALAKRNVATLDLFVRENFPDSLVGSPTDKDGEGLVRIERQDSVVWEFKASDIKWYETYPEVQAFDEFWNKFCQVADSQDDPEAGEEPVHWACEFIRIGENTDDIEDQQSNNPEWLLQVSRVIDRNY